MTRRQQSSAAVYPAVNSWGDRALFWTVDWELFGEKQGSWLFDRAVRVRKDTSCPLAVFPLFHGRHFPGTTLVFSKELATRPLVSLIWEKKEMRKYTQVRKEGVQRRTFSLKYFFLGEKRWYGRNDQLNKLFFKMAFTVVCYHCSVIVT